MACYMTVGQKNIPRRERKREKGGEKKMVNLGKIIAIFDADYIYLSVVLAKKSQQKFTYEIVIIVTLYGGVYCTQILFPAIIISLRNYYSREYMITYLFSVLHRCIDYKYHILGIGCL